MMTLEAIYQKLTTEGFKFKFEGPGIIIKGNTRILEPLKPTLEARKHEFIALVFWNERSRWPAESLEAEHKAGCRHARLYPFLGHHVRSSYGEGVLFRVFEDSAGITIEADDVTKVLYCPPTFKARRSHSRLQWNRESFDCAGTAESYA